MWDNGKYTGSGIKGTGFKFCFPRLVKQVISSPLIPASSSIKWGVRVGWTKWTDRFISVLSRGSYDPVKNTYSSLCLKHGTYNTTQQSRWDLTWMHYRRTIMSLLPDTLLIQLSITEGFPVALSYGEFKFSLWSTKTPRSSMIGWWTLNVLKLSTSVLPW